MEKKDDVGVDALEKALVTLETLTKSEKDEKAELFQKSMTSELSEAEKARLVTLISGGTNVEPLAKSVTASIAQPKDPEVQAAVDVSPFLKAISTGNVEALSTLADTMEKSFAGQSEWNQAIGQAVGQIGLLVKSLRDEVHGWAEGTNERPKAAQTVTQAQVLQKSFAGNPNQGGAGQDGEHLSKSVILDTMEAMHQDSIQKGRGGLANCGEDLNKSIAKYEQTGRMTKQLVEEVKAYRAKRA